MGTLNMGRRIPMIALAASIGIALSLVILLSLSGLAFSAETGSHILYVALDGVCGGETPCYSNPQEAVNDADTADEIRVAEGTYTKTNNLGGLEQVLYITKTVTVRGGYTIDDWDISYPLSNPTTIDAQKLGRGVYISGDISPTIDGLRITNGDATDLLGDAWFGDRDAGGGVYIISATATIKNSEIFSNSGPDFGGGLYINRSSTFLSNSTVTKNTAFNGGGVAIWFSDATLDSNVITNNSNSGVWLYSQGSTFSQNIVSNNSSDFSGGGFDLIYGIASFDRNTISNNSALHDGGGVSLYSFSRGQFEGNKIISNTAHRSGGGLYVSWLSAAELTNTVVTENTADNRGSGIYISRAALNSSHATVANNSNGEGQGIYVTTDLTDTFSTVILTNTILSDHKVGIHVSGGNTVTVNSVLWYQSPITVSQEVTSVVTVQNQYTGDPAFASDGYHLSTNSAAIDLGVDAGVTIDIDGEKRPLGDGYDLGADEFAAAELGFFRIYLPFVIKSP